MKVGVKLFARVRDMVDADSIELTLESPATIADLKAELVTKYPDLEPLVPVLLFAIGTEFANDNVQIQPHDEIACFPPVSGG